MWCWIYNLKYYSWKKLGIIIHKIYIKWTEIYVNGNICIKRNKTTVYSHKPDFLLKWYSNEGNYQRKGMHIIHFYSIQLRTLLYNVIHIFKFVAVFQSEVRYILISYCRHFWTHGTFVQFVFMMFIYILLNFSQ